MAGYIGNGPGVGRASRFLFLAEEAQTSFGGMDALGMTLRYTPGFVEVAVNGMWLPPNEYTAADGSTISFSMGLSAGDKVYVYVLSTFSAADTISPTDSAFPWFSKAIGEVFMVDESLTGVAIPPVSHSILVFIKLTKDLTGSGLFNEGKLTNQIVSGAAPLVLATADISIAGSPMNGETIHLLNTEGRILRPSETAGSLQNDAIQSHRHPSVGGYMKTGPYETTDAGPGSAFGNVGSTNGGNIQDMGWGDGRMADETRMKNIGVSAYMRVR